MTAPQSKKFCKGCQRTLPLAAFYVNTTKSDGRQTYCKECDKRKANDRQRNRRQSDPKYRARRNTYQQIRRKSIPTHQPKDGSSAEPVSSGDVHMDEWVSDHVWPGSREGFLRWWRGKKLDDYPRTIYRSAEWVAFEHYIIWEREQKEKERQNK